MPDEGSASGPHRTTEKACQLNFSPASLSILMESDHALFIRLSAAKRGWIDALLGEFSSVRQRQVGDFGVSVVRSGARRLAGTSKPVKM